MEGVAVLAVQPKPRLTLTLRCVEVTWGRTVFCKPVPGGCPRPPAGSRSWPRARGLHSSTFQLNLGALYGIGGVRRGRVARVKGVLGGV
jgi:hypothetical protein